MDKLYPIIRRKRRPLVEQNAETLKPETLKSEARVQSVVLADSHHAEPDKPEANDAAISPTNDAP
jgi:hypothetical protein